MGYVQEEHRQFLSSQNDTHHGTLEEDHTDSDSELDGEIEAYIKQMKRKRWEESNLEEARQILWHSRAPALLRANKQIYSEAYPLLYSELKIVLSPGAVLKHLMHPDPLAKPMGGIWRHDPAMGVGFKDINGHMCYESKCMDGEIEPHIFAKFERIVFNARFHINDYAEPPALFVDENLRVDPDDEINFKNYIRNSAVFQGLVRLISNSPLIKHLQICLNVEVFMDCNYSQGSDNDGSNVDNEGFTAGKRKIQKMTAAANERAAELFLESGLLDPLQTLSNVRSFAVIFERNAYRSIGTLWQPPPRYASVIEELKKTIESNWRSQVD